MEPILTAVIPVVIIGIICAAVLVIASKIMAVKEDERFPVIRECLPGANCGACGFAGCDGYAKALAEKRNDSYIYTSEAEDGGEVDNPQNIWPVYFGQELRNNIIPTVESTYSTYARKDVSESNLVATRDHRAFSGLSRGSMTVARSGLTDNADIFAYFGNYSGIWQEFDTFKTALTQDYKDYPIKFWYNGNGKMDFAKPNHDEFMDKVKAKMPDTFTDGENFAYVVLKDGAHIYKSWLVDLYNSLLVFYK